jgi:hypothetical protein
MIEATATGVAGVFGGLAVAFAMAGPPQSADPGSHPEAPPPAHTGGFGEPTCLACHAEYALDDGIRVALLRVPELAAPGSTHRIEIVVEAEGTLTAGFQLSARTPDGRQAGLLRPTDERVVVTSGETPAGEVLFAHHTMVGIGDEERAETTWTVEWVAPDRSGEVQWHVAGNSANGDRSPYGDLVGASFAATRVRRTR